MINFIIYYYTTMMMLGVRQIHASQYTGQGSLIQPGGLGSQFGLGFRGKADARDIQYTGWHPVAPCSLTLLGSVGLEPGGGYGHRPCRPLSGYREVKRAGAGGGAGRGAGGTSCSWCAHRWRMQDLLLFFVSQVGHGALEPAAAIWPAQSKTKPPPHE